MSTTKRSPLPELLTESEAAGLLGWTAANLRSHRERHAAGLLAESLTPKQACALLALADDEPVAELPRALADLRRLVRVANVGEAVPTWERSQLGIAVTRRLRAGDRQFAPPPAIRIPSGGRRYRLKDLRQWMRDHPEIAQRERLAERTLSTDEAAALMGIGSATLKSQRSKAHRAQLRIDAGQALEGDRALVRSSPPWHWVGAEKRYREREIRTWARSRGRRLQEPDPLLDREPVTGPVLSEHNVAREVGISPQCLAGYRSRARRALRQILEHPDDPVPRGVLLCSLAVPHHVLVDGRKAYRPEAVEAWRRAREAVRAMPRS